MTLPVAPAKIIPEKISTGKAPMHPRELWELAARMLDVYDNAAKLATGTANTRRIVRMSEVVKALRKEFNG